MIPTWPQLQLPVFKLSLSFVLTLIAIMILSKFLPKTTLMKHFNPPPIRPRKNLGYEASADTHRWFRLKTGTSFDPIKTCRYRHVLEKPNWM